MAHLTRTLAFLLLMLAVVLGGFAIMLARSPAPHPSQAPQNAPATAADTRLTPVVVAARDLPVGQPLDAAALTVRMQAEPASGVFADPNALTGRVTRAAVVQGAPLTEAVLSTGLADVVLPGERAVAVQIDETNAVGNYVRPGNFVDVFFTLKREGAGASDAEIQATQTRLLLSKVRVLSMGAASVGGGTQPNAADAGANAQNNRSAASRTAVLAVRTADVDAITLAESAGRIVLALRNGDDDETPPPQSIAPLVQVKSAAPDNGSARAAAGVSLGALAFARMAHAAQENAAPRAAVSAAPAARTVARASGIEVIRGGRVEHVAD